MRQKFPESLVEIGPGLLARRVESHSPLVEDDRATTDLQYARNMMRCQNHKIAFPAVSLKKFFEQINAAAIVAFNRFMAHTPGVCEMHAGNLHDRAGLFYGCARAVCTGVGA